MRSMPPSRSGSRSRSRTRTAGNIGGGGFMLIRLADGRTTFLDFRERAPGAASRNMYLDASGKATEDSIVGYRASGVPGTVSGFEYASKKYGRKPWADVVRPAVELAAKGFPHFLRAGAGAARTAARLLSRFPESNRIFLRGGKFYEPGETVPAARARPHPRPHRADRARKISTKAKPRACSPKICRSTAA